MNAFLSDLLFTAAVVVVWEAGKFAGRALVHELRDCRAACRPQAYRSPAEQRPGRPARDGVRSGSPEFARLVGGALRHGIRVRGDRR